MFFLKHGVVAVHWARYHWDGWPLASLSHVLTILAVKQSPELTQPGHPSEVGKMSTSENWGVDRHTTRCTGPVSQCKLVCGWKLWKRRSAPRSGPVWLGKDSAGVQIQYLMFGKVQRAWARLMHPRRCGCCSCGLWWPRPKYGNATINIVRESVDASRGCWTHIATTAWPAPIPRDSATNAAAAPAAKTSK